MRRTELYLCPEELAHGNLSSPLVCTSVIIRQGIVQTSSIDSVSPSVLSTFQKEYYESWVSLKQHTASKSQTEVSVYQKAGKKKKKKRQNPQSSGMTARKKLVPGHHQSFSQYLLLHRIWISSLCATHSIFYRELRHTSSWQMNCYVEISWQ